MKGIVGVFEHVGRDFVGKALSVAFAVDVEVRDGYLAFTGGIYKSLKMRTS